MIEKYSYQELEKLGYDLPKSTYHPDALYDDMGYIMNDELDGAWTYETDEKIHLSSRGTNENRCRKLRCKQCDGDKFEVAQEHYFTAIKCVNCLWEQCIHEG